MTCFNHWPRAEPGRAGQRPASTICPGERRGGREGGAGRPAYFSTPRPLCGNVSPSPDAHGSIVKRSPITCSASLSREAAPIGSQACQRPDADCPDPHASTAERPPSTSSTAASVSCPAEPRIDPASARPGAPSEPPMAAGRKARLPYAHRFKGGVDEAIYPLSELW